MSLLFCCSLFVWCDLGSTSDRWYNRTNILLRSDRSDQS